MNISLAWPTLVACAFLFCSRGFGQSPNIFPSSGNAGVGTNAPGSIASNVPTLDLRGQISTRSAGVLLTSSNGSEISVLSDLDSNLRLGTVSSLPLTFWTTNIERMRVTPSGNVGIGTSSPVTKFQITGDNAELGFARSTVDGNAYTRLGMTTNFDTYWATNATYTGTAWNFVTTAGWGGKASRIDQYNGAIQLDTVSGGTNPISWTTRLYVANNGNVGIGTTNPTHPLSVNGTVRAKEVIVETTGWSDYVFDKAHRLQPLTEVEAAIAREGHLPGIPSAKQVADQGISLGDMQAKLLAKIEELTLHQIEQEKELARLRNRVAELEHLNSQ